MKTVYEALSFTREHAETKRDKGTQFERLTHYFFKNDPFMEGTIFRCPALVKRPYKRQCRLGDRSCCTGHNGRPPLAWMIDRHQVKTDKASGITNDPNEYSDDPLYIPQLIQRLVTVSVKTMEIVDSMLPINEMEQPIDWPEAWKTSY